MSESSRCPDPEILSAFVAGTLSGDEFEMTAKHLLTCDACIFIVDEAARADREHPSVTSPETLVSRPIVFEPVRKRLPAWLAIAAAALVGLVLLGVWWTGRIHENTAIAALIEASPRDSRYLEARPSGGFRWAPLRSLARGESPADAQQMKLIGAAGTVLQEHGDDPAPEAQRTVAIAHLISGNPKEAVRLLTPLARKNPDARTWSDLAAAHYTIAAQTSNPAELTRALAAADAALRMDPRFAEALFNRALIVERLGLRQQARTAWERYLELDGESAWASEARRHLDHLAPPAVFRDEMERRYWSLAQSPSLARNLASRFPGEARVWGETEILGRWAEAVKRDDPDDAARHLSVARAFGEQLASQRADFSLKSAVEAVERLTPDRLMTLVDAHLLFRAAQKRYTAGRPAEAEKMFARAADAFEVAGSPVALTARYYAANTIYDQGRLKEAHARLEALLLAMPLTFPAHRAQVEWQLGLTNASRGQWGEAMRTLKDSITTFERLDEKFYATSVREILAQVYDRIGNPAAAWHHRVLALQQLGRAETLRLQVAMFSAARAAAGNGDCGVSIALIGLQVDMARSIGDDLLFVEMLLLRARMYARLGDFAAARADLAGARKGMAKISDPAFAQRAKIEYEAIDATLAATPQDSVARLSAVIDFHNTKGRRMFLPELYLQRGRALLSLGRSREAAEDFDRGIEELEAQRNTINEDRSGVFVLAGELFDEAVALALERGESAKALSYSERGRARQLLDVLDDRPRGTTGTANTTVIEYVSLPKTLVIFVSRGGQLDTVKESIAREALEDDVDHLAHGVSTRSNQEFARAASRLHSHLIAPIADRLTRGSALVFIPDATLRDVPFAALIAPSGRYLVEDHSIVVTPSAAVYGKLAASPRHGGPNPQLLLIEGAKTRAGELGYLANVDREADAIKAEYQNVVKVAPRQIDAGTFAASAANADVIHFVGHATSDEWDGPALLTPGGPLGDNRLDASEIAAAKLSKTTVVVLAGCETADGSELAREGNISIARAFLAAGVPSVIATQWPIDDHDAAEFFPRLHHHLVRGWPPAEALRFAQLESIHGETPPFLWAGVQVIGS